MRNLTTISNINSRYTCDGCGFDFSDGYISDTGAPDYDPRYYCQQCGGDILRIVMRHPDRQMLRNQLAAYLLQILMEYEKDHNAVEKIVDDGADNLILIMSGRRGF